MKKTFALIADLGPLSDAARTEYLRDLSVHVGLDPDEHTLGMVWMNNDSGTKTLVAYVRRVDAEKLRDSRQISVSSLTHQETCGEIIFTATGVDGTGRQEIAIGSHSIEGLKGDKRSYAVMIASTRALRRLTLQFVGAGLYDESEVNAVTADINASGSSLAQLAGSPTVIPPIPTQPNPQPGKDVTEPTPEQKAAQTVLDNMSQKTEAPKTPRKRRRVNTVELQPAQTEMPVGHIDNKGEITSVTLPSMPQEAVDFINKASQIGQSVSAPTAPSPVPPVTVPVAEPKPPQVVQPVVASLPPEKKAEFTARMNKYVWEILVAGGMTNDENLGVSAKLRKFALKLVGAVGTQLSTEEQYIEVLEFLDGYLVKNGPQALVAYIEAAIK